MFAVGMVLIVATGFFVAAEFALVNLDRADIDARMERGERGLRRISRGLSRTSTHLSSAQLGITLTTLLTGFAMEPAVSALLSVLCDGWGWDAGVTYWVALITSVLVATLLSMLIGELVPKNFALAVPLKTAKVVMPVQAAFTFIFRPAVAGLNGTANGILKLFGVTPVEELSSARTPEELSALVLHSARAGFLEKDTATLLSKTLRFSERTAADVMTPRPRVIDVSAHDPVLAVLESARRTGYSRFPVVGDDLDDLLGVVHVKYAMAVPRERRAEVPVSAIMTEPLRVPETMTLDNLLAELRGKGYQLAVVIDEYGGTAGITTLEDVVEELIGEVADEHDRTAAGVVRSGESTTFPANLRPDELIERTGISVPENPDYETVAGFVMSELGELPKINDEVACSGGILRVVRMDGRRIDRLRFTPDGEPHDRAPQAGGAS
jgi:CBS domain containing-hemolysin-like protein